MALVGGIVHAHGALAEVVIDVEWRVVTHGCRGTAERVVSICFGDGEPLEESVAFRDRSRVGDGLESEL